MRTSAIFFSFFLSALRPELADWEETSHMIASIVNIVVLAKTYLNIWIASVFASILLQCDDFCSIEIRLTRFCVIVVLVLWQGKWWWWWWWTNGHRHRNTLPRQECYNGRSTRSGGRRSKTNESYCTQCRKPCGHHIKLFWSVQLL